MATKTTTLLTDDIDGGPAHVTLSYSWDGQAYEIDLNTRNAEEFAEALAPYLAASRKAAGARHAAGGARRRGSGGAANGRAGGDLDPQAVRAWAAEQGLEVSARGRVAASVVEQYRAAHPA